MTAFEKFNSIDAYTKNLVEYSAWEQSKKFNSIGRTIFSNEKVAYTVLDKRERISKTAGKVALGVLGVFVVIFSFGCLLTFKDIKHLFTGREVKRFALEKSMVDQYNNERFSSANKMQNILNSLESSLIIKDPLFIDISEAEITVSDDSTDESSDTSTSASSTSTSETVSDTESSISDTEDLNGSEQPSIDVSFSKSIADDLSDEVKGIGEAEKEAIAKAEFKAAAEASSLKASELLKENIFAAVGEGKDVLNTLNLVGDLSLMAHHALACTNKKLKKFFEERSETLIGKVELIIRQVHFNNLAYSYGRYNKPESHLYCKKINLSERISALADETEVTNKYDIIAINIFTNRFQCSRSHVIDVCKLNFKVKCYQEYFDLNRQVDNLIIQLREHVERGVRQARMLEEKLKQRNPGELIYVSMLCDIPMPDELRVQISVVKKAAVKAKDQNVIDKIVFYFLVNTEYFFIPKNLFELIEIDSVEKAEIVEKYLSSLIYKYQKDDQNNIDLQGKLAKYRETQL